MTELKTLKELEIKEIQDIAEVEVSLTPDGILPSMTIKKQREIVYSNDLRTEAIKWIKGIENSDKTNFSVDGFDVLANYEIGYVENHSAGIIKFIKHFFNITEQDLSKNIPKE